MIGDSDLWRLGTRTTTTDAEGRTTETFAWEDVQGRVDELSTREVALAAQAGQSHDIVALAPLETDVNDRQVIEVVTPARLAGRYEIDSIRMTRLHLRVLGSRSTVKD